MEEPKPIKDSLHSDSIADHVTQMVQRRSVTSGFDHTYQIMTPEGMTTFHFRLYIVPHPEIRHAIEDAIRKKLAELQALEKD